MVITVGSGKGGTGKTLISTSLAMSIGNVQFFDCDVEEPNSYIFIKPVIEEEIGIETFVPEVDLSKCNFCKKCQEICRYNAIAVLKNKVIVFEQLCHHCGACIWVCPNKAISEKKVKLGTIRKGKSDSIEFFEGRLEVGQATSPPLIRELKKYIEKGKDVIIDSAPGVACPFVNAVYGSDFVILVTEPTPFGLYDLKLAVEVCENLNLKKGVIINRSGKGDNLIEDFCREKNIPVILKIPFRREIAEGYSKGLSLPEIDPQYKMEFKTLFEKIKNL
ncbi:MAG: (4Fe-4S)-binding protein [Candidatus Omnitrophota bacterium]|nr:MAG: (4Fe-4S)-binding protein [Candidatus Omnitrophota bacterium]